MIALKRLQQAMADIPTGGMQTGSKQVRVEHSDAQRLVLEFEALQAQVSRLRKALEFFADDELLDIEAVSFANDVLHATPAQCLADAKAQAATEFLPEIKRHLSKRFASIDVLNEFDCAIVDAHATFISKLRQAAKDGTQ